MKSCFFFKYVFCIMIINHAIRILIPRYVKYITEIFLFLNSY